MEKRSALAAGHPLPKCFADTLLVIRRGKGARLQDRSGRWYLDVTGGIAVNALGYGRADLARIAARQMRRLTHISNLYTTEPLLELGAKMLASGGFAAVQFLSSGSVVYRLEICVRRRIWRAAMRARSALP